MVEALTSEFAISADLPCREDIAVRVSVATQLTEISVGLFPYFALNEGLALLIRESKSEEPLKFTVPLEGITAAGVEEAFPALDAVPFGTEVKLEAVPPALDTVDPVAEEVVVIAETSIPKEVLETVDEVDFEEVVFVFVPEQPENTPINKTLATIIEVTFFNEPTPFPKKYICVFYYKRIKKQMINKLLMQN